MVLAVDNRSGFTCEQFPMAARNGANFMRIVVKAGYSWASGDRLELLEQQPEVQMEDEYWKDPLSSEAVRIESDISLDKPHTDLIVNGCARAPNGRPARSVDVGLRYCGRVLKRLRVFGDRAWYRSGTGFRMTEPLPFESMPLTYARAYGGRDAAGAEPRNLLGMGYVTKPDAAFEGKRAPNVELASDLITSASDRPQPAGLGVVARNSQPRLSYAGTYDAAWQEERFPLLPEDFDDRFNQVADAAQWIPRPRGGEEIAITGMASEGTIAITLPPCELRVGLHYRTRVERKAMDLDCVLVDTDARTLTLTWRAGADVHGDPFQLLATVIDASDVGRSAAARCC